jgi:hypothetical protein
MMNLIPTISVEKCVHTREANLNESVLNWETTVDGGGRRARILAIFFDLDTVYQFCS